MPKFPGMIYTQADVARRYDPSGRANAIIEILSQTNEIIGDARAVGCNHDTTHVTTIRDNIPEPKYGLINQGYAKGKSAVRQIVENTCNLNISAPIDDRLLNLCGTPSSKNEFLVGEAAAFLEGLNQKFVKTLFYGDMGVDPGAIDGLNKRYNSLNPDNPISRQVIDMGGTGPNLTSIWLIQWGDTATGLLYPKNTPAGIRMRMDNTILYDDAGGAFPGRMIFFDWDMGLVVRDWRKIVRFCNIDMSALTTLVEQGASTPEAFRLRRALENGITLLPSVSRGETFFYMNRVPLAMLNILGGEKGNVNLTYDNPGGAPQPYTNILGIPVRRVDGLIAETQVTA